MTTGALGKRPKSKVKINKDFCTTEKGPQVEVKNKQGLLVKVKDK